jgi:hypothetical protein
MPRQSFFEDIRSHHISSLCKEKRHSDCDGWVPRKEFNGHDHECSCHCHLTIAERMRLKARKQINPRYK